jgi:hypothetical protein
MSFNYSPKIVNDSSLVLYLDAANNKSYVSGSTAWNDISRGGNNGILVNGPTFSSANGGSIVFDGSNDYVSFNINATNISFSGELTFNIWYKYLNGVGDTSLLEIGGNYNSWSLYWDIADTLGYLSFSINGNYVFRVTSTTSTKTGAWCNSCGTFSNGTAKIYTNGILDNTRIGLTLLNQTGILEGRIAKDNGSNIMGGNISVAQIYNRALSSSEILQNYNATKTRFGL